MKFSVLLLLAIARSWPAAEGLHHCKLTRSGSNTNLIVTEDDGCTGSVPVAKCAGDCASSMVPRVFTQ